MIARFFIGCNEKTETLPAAYKITSIDKVVNKQNYRLRDRAIVEPYKIFQRWCSTIYKSAFYSDVYKSPVLTARQYLCECFQNLITLSEG